MKKVLLFNPPSALGVYGKSRIRAVIPKLPSMSLAMTAASAMEGGAKVKIADLVLYSKDQAEEIIRQEILQFKPDIVGVTASTPLFSEAAQISGIAKSISRHITTVLGGPHASSLPRRSLRESSFDIVVAGEGEGAVKDIVDGKCPQDIEGVYCRASAQGVDLPSTAQNHPHISMDRLPVPALELYDSRHYVCSKVIARNNPVGPMEMSRGCVYGCTFCNKTVHGRNFRTKKPARIIEELRKLKELGYREFHVIDDQFTTDIGWAKEVCEEILRKDIGMSWNLRVGIRVDTVDKEFLDIAKRSGCYQMGIGYESGNQSSLNAVNKSLNIQEAVEKTEMIRRSGIEAAGFFMLGLPGETVESLEETVRYAIRLDIDYAKATILVPFPGTEVYDDFKKKGLIKTEDWSRYNFHNAHEIYSHPTLSWDILERYYNLFYKRFYLRPSFLWKTFWNSLIKGQLFSYLYYGYQTLWCKRR